MTPEATAELERLRRGRPGVGEALVFQMPMIPAALWRGEKVAGNTATLQKCYQMANEETMEAVVLHTRQLG